MMDALAAPWIGFTLDELAPCEIGGFLDVQRNRIWVVYDITNITCLVVSNVFYLPFHIWDVILPIDQYFSEG